MFPYDNENHRHIVSANGKYIFRFYFNGCWRRVEIDDRLPTSKSKRTLHVVDRAHPDLLWPALLEKAYLKIRGGYDFPGSNSATDVAVEELRDTDRVGVSYDNDKHGVRPGENRNVP